MNKKLEQELGNILETKIDLQNIMDDLELELPNFYIFGSLRDDLELAEYTARLTCEMFDEFAGKIEELEEKIDVLFEDN